MNKRIKRIGILAFLLIPILFFMFLMNFGSNHFDLPYFGPRLGVTENGDTIYSSVNINDIKKGQVSVLVFSDSSGLATAKLNQLSRLYNWYKNKYPLKFVFIGDSIETNLYQGFSIQSLNDDVLSVQQKLFLMNEKVIIEKEEVSVHDVFTLLDQSNHIRGYYDGTNGLELNRLKEEVSILIKNNR